MPIRPNARGNDWVAETRARFPQVFARSAAEKARLWLFWIGVAALTLYAFWATGFLDLGRLVDGTAKLGFMLGLMWPPAHNGWFGDFAWGILETLSMAFIGTLLAALAALPLGFLGARNVLPTWIFHFGLRRFLDGLRGVDQLIWALVFVNVVGLGPFAGIMAIAVSDTGTLAKLFAEAIEGVERKQVDGVRAAGAGNTLVMRLGMLPQVLPVILSNVLYFFESNTRSATILGVVGAGGIGLHLSDRIRANNWDEAAFIILMILVTVSVIDYLSRRLRESFIGEVDHRP